MRCATIDLGTNTFHLLIVECKKSGEVVTIFRERKYIKLAEEGIDKIGEKSFKRAFNALAYFKKVIDQNNVDQLRAFGTAAMRTASNAQDLIKKVFEEIGINIEIISGDKEAYLIAEGVKQIIPIGIHPEIIMDIGGGSVEFIILTKNNIIWQKSFPIGVAILFNKFHNSQPISPSEINKLESYIGNFLKPLFFNLSKYKCKRLIGASGTFDVLKRVLVKKDRTDSYDSLTSKSIIDFYSFIIDKNLPQILDIPGIPANRADLVLVAMILLKYVLVNSQINDVAISDYALKEGILQEMKNS